MLIKLPCYPEIDLEINHFCSLPDRNREGGVLVYILSSTCNLLQSRTLSRPRFRLPSCVRQEHRRNQIIGQGQSCSLRNASTLLVHSIRQTMRRKFNPPRLYSFLTVIIFQSDIKSHNSPGQKSLEKSQLCSEFWVRHSV